MAITHTKLDDRASMNSSENGHWISTLHPYDLAEYHWAHSDDGKNWGVWLGTRRLHSNPVFCGAVFGEPADIPEILRGFDRKAGIKSNIDKS